MVPQMSGAIIEWKEKKTRNPRTCVSAHEVNIGEGFDRPATLDVELNRELDDYLNEEHFH
jgi:hypothetical protein